MTRLSVDVSFDPAHGYVGTAPELRTAVRALSLNGLRKQVEDQLAGRDLDIRLVLDRVARLERDARRKGGQSRASDHARATTKPRKGGSELFYVDELRRTGGLNVHIEADGPTVFAHGAGGHRVEAHQVGADLGIGVASTFGVCRLPDRNFHLFESLKHRNIMVAPTE